MCCFFDIKIKFMLFFCISLSLFALSYADERVTQTPNTPSPSASLSPSASSWFTQGLASLMLISTGVQTLSAPYATPLEQQPHLSFNPAHSDGAITGLCYSSCTQKCAPQLMLSNGLIPYCVFSIKQAGGLLSPSLHLKNDALTWCSELSIGEFSAMSNQTSAGTTVHFSIHPKENFSLQNQRISCRIENTQISKDLSEARLVVTKKDSIERQKRQADATNNVCRPDANNCIYLGQENLTRCLEQNPEATFFFVENIDFSLLPQAEKNQFPLYNDSLPFSGQLTMPPFSLNNFNITRDVQAAFFDTLTNSNIDANFSNAEVTGSSDTALLAIFLREKNAIVLEIDSLQVKTNSNGDGITAGVASVLSQNSTSLIVFKIKKRGTIEMTHLRSLLPSGMAVGFIDAGSDYNITVLGNEIFMMCRGTAACGGVVGRSRAGNGNNMFLDIKANLVNITSDSGGISAVIGFGSFNNAYVKMNAHINHIILNNSAQEVSIILSPASSTTLTSSPPQQIMIMSNIQAEIIGLPSALGVMYSNNIRRSITIFLLSGNGTLGPPRTHQGYPSNLLFPQKVCSESLIDWSGISFNTHNVGCAHATLVESITSSGWRIAHNRFAQHVCTDNPHACHYVNEVPLALVKGDTHTFFLINQQTHPYNNTITGQGPIRVTQWHWNDLNAPPRINDDFAINGTQLYSANAQVFPASLPLSVSADSEYLFMLFDEGDTKLVSLPLTMHQDTSYQIRTIEGLEGNPVQLVGKDLWIQKGDRLNRFTVFPNVRGPSLSISLEINHPVVGVAQIKNYIYVAYTMNIEGTNRAHVLRFRTDGTLTWQATLAGHDDYRYRQLDVRGNETHHVITLPLITETTHESFEGKTLTVLLPPRGGYGDWFYGEIQTNTTKILSHPHNTEAKYLNITVASVVILVSMAIAGAGGTSMLYKKSRSKKIKLGEKTNKTRASIEAVRINAVSNVGESSENDHADTTDTGNESESDESSLNGHAGIIGTDKVSELIESRWP